MNQIIKSLFSVFLISISMVCLSSCASPPKERGKSYLATEHWHRYQKFLPESMKYKAHLLPKEEYWEWNSHRVHLDRYSRKNAPCKVIIVHGGGGNGRILSPLAIPILANTECEILAPDFPGYGLTVVPSEAETQYEDWVELLSDLIDKERVPGQKIFVFGLSIGGMLSYHATAKNQNLDGLIVTTLADVREPNVRDAVAMNKFLSRVGIPLNSFFYWLTDPIHLPIRYLSKMDLITNDPEFSDVFASDPYAGGGQVSLRFLRTFMSYSPEIEPENFQICPVLMVHPGLDPWTPYSLSKEFFDKIASAKKSVILEGSGHLPYEEPGRTQMFESIFEFISKKNP